METICKKCKYHIQREYYCYNEHVCNYYNNNDIESIKINPVTGEKDKTYTCFDDLCRTHRMCFSNKSGECVHFEKRLSFWEKLKRAIKNKGDE